MIKYDNPPILWCTRLIVSAETGNPMEKMSIWSQQLWERERE